jgi:hypothetical protein
MDYALPEPRNNVRKVWLVISGAIAGALLVTLAGCGISGLTGHPLYGGGPIYSRPRACYELSPKFTSRASIRHTNAAQCIPARVDAKRS